MKPSLVAVGALVASIGAPATVLAQTAAATLPPPPPPPTAPAAPPTGAAAGAAQATTAPPPSAPPLPPAPPPPVAYPPAVAAPLPASGAPSPAPLDGTYTYTVATPKGNVDIDRTLPSEVGKWGWSWFGDRSVGLPGSAGATGGSDVSLSMIGVRHWLSPKVGFEAGTGLVVWSPAGGSTTIVSLGFQGGALYSLARYEYLNIFAAGRAFLVPYSHPADGVTVIQFGLSGEVAAEFFLDGLQLFHAGPLLRTSRAVSVTFGMGLGFNFSNYSVSGGGGTSETKLATYGPTDTFKGITTGSLAFTYYFGWPSGS